MDIDQLGDILVCVRGAHEAMIGRYVQPVLAVQQPQARAGEPVPLAHIVCIQNMEPTPVAMAG
jgi:hypothetical protein